VQAKADLAVEVFRALSEPDGGNPELSLSELVARAARAMAGPRQRCVRGRRAPCAKHCSRITASSWTASRSWMTAQGPRTRSSEACPPYCKQSSDQAFRGLPSIPGLPRPALHTESGAGRPNTHVEVAEKRPL